MPLNYIQDKEYSVIAMNKDNQIIVVKQSPSIGGSLLVEGAKNAVLPIISAALLARGVSRIYQVPNSQDVHHLIELIEYFGARASFSIDKQTLEIDSTQLHNTLAPTSLYQSMKASTLVAGALISRLGEVWLGFPGGDNIGKRPINLHLEGFALMGASIAHLEHYIRISAKKLSGAEIFLDYPSVGATQNLLMAAASIDESTTLYNVAQEPEVEDLITVLVKMGAKITYQAPATLYIKGNSALRPFEHTIMPDRLEAGTLLLAAAITKGAITIANAPAYAMQILIKKLQNMGHMVEVGKHGFGISFIATDNPKAVNLKTMPYPGFATDLQSPMMALLAITPGQSTIHETVFESRMSHAYELNKMGASIAVEYDFARICGVEKLQGADVKATDIRACAALVLAGLAAEGTTRISGVHHLLRGYQGLDRKLRSIGGDVVIVDQHISSHEADLFGAPIGN